MSNTWKTGASAPAPKTIKWPTLGQLAGQIGVIVVIALLWGGVLAAVLFLTVAPAGPTQSPPVEAAASAPTLTPTLPPTDTPLPPSPTPAPTDTPAPTPTTAAGQPEESPPAEPSPTATNTPSPEPTATNTAEPPSPTPPPADTSGISFAAEVLPIFENRCVKCHGGEETKEGLDLTTHAGALAGSWNGTVIEPGNPAESYLIEQIESGEMPKKEPRLLPADIRTITEWIAAGAPDN